MVLRHNMLCTTSLPTNNLFKTHTTFFYFVLTLSINSFYLFFLTTYLLCVIITVQSTSTPPYHPSLPLGPYCSLLHQYFWKHHISSYENDTFSFLLHSSSSTFILYSYLSYSLTFGSHSVNVPNGAYKDM